MRRQFGEKDPSSRSGKNGAPKPGTGHGEKTVVHFREVSLEI